MTGKQPMEGDALVLLEASGPRRASEIGPGATQLPWMNRTEG